MTLALLLSLMMTGPSEAAAIPLVLNDVPTTGNVKLYNSMSYVPLRAVTKLLDPAAQIFWTNEQAVLKAPSLHFTVHPRYFHLNCHHMPKTASNLSAALPMCLSAYFLRPWELPSHGMAPQTGYPFTRGAALSCLRLHITTKMHFIGYIIPTNLHCKRRAGRPCVVYRKLWYSLARGKNPVIICIKTAPTFWWVRFL
jgi:hypothetical protein